MIRSCTDPYYLRLVFEFLNHTDLLETANVFTRECNLKKYQLQLDEELLGSEQTTQYVPKIVFYLPSALNGNENNVVGIPEEIEHFFSHDDMHNIHINTNMVGEKKIKTPVTKETSKVQCLSETELASNPNTFRKIKNYSKKYPVLLKLKGRQSAGDRLIEGESTKLKDYNLNYSELQMKFNKLHSDYHNLIGVASELTGALEMSARGQQLDLRETLKNCVQIYPELFSYDKYHKNVSKEGIKGRFSVKLKQSDWSLDIPQIKRNLIDGSVKSRLLLLQALRWAITKSPSDRRESILKQYVGWDLLNLQDDAFLKSLLIPHGVVTPHPLQQSAARLLNTIASIQSGRSYLSQNSETIRVTTAVLQQRDGISSDSITQNMLLAALQKLSLRRNQRIAMIKAGMVEWLFEQFSNLDVDSMYPIEYGTALLMNLCLHHSARELCIPVAENVFSVLISLLSTPVTQALAYVNGTLYSLITNTKLNEAASDMGLQNALEYSISIQKDAEIKKQMEHILHFHKTLLHCSNFTSAYLPISEGEMIDEDDAELNLLGEELDEDDPVRSINGELSGEDLLRNRYCLSENSEETSLSESEPSETHGSSLMLRPTTPHNQSLSTSKNSPEKNIAREILNWSKSKFSIADKQKIDNQRYDPGTDSSGSTKSENKIISSKETVWHQIKSEEADGSTNIPLIIQTGDAKQLIPEISIHLADNVENSINNDSDVDEDSEDVQVAGMIPELQKEQYNDRFSSDTEDGDTAPAFTSRPKIPRTPPHHS
ncbi:LisH domain-containing protein ARMC9 [Frankliniella fusca]|uniref:LisH domain-containing protein ARMC9 n=1 Tax=Frankliniella fusca TaxID=407009 RepID=A0AAE1I264_9NEOP|nr:LisH domain-containing protein ARMC9 [Frankliniella fusca]